VSLIRSKFVVWAEKFLNRIVVSGAAATVIAPGVESGVQKFQISRLK